MKKIIAIILALVMCMSLFVGFTQVDPSDLAVVKYDVSTGEITRIGEEPQSLTGAVRFPDGSTSYSASVSADVTRVNIGFKYAGNINELRVDNIIYHNYDFSSGYGYSALNIMGLTPGNHVITWSTRYGNDSYHQYTLNLKVGTVSEPVTTSIVQFLSRQQEPNKIIYSSVVNLNSALVMLGDNFDLGLKADEVISAWTYYNINTKSWTKIDPKYPPQITTDKLENGVFKVAPIIDTKDVFSITYYVQEAGFLNIKTWKEAIVYNRVEGEGIPDVLEVYGDVYDYISWDKKGILKVLATDKVDQDHKVYVHLKPIDETKTTITYFAKDYEISPYQVHKIKWLSKGEKVDLSIYAPTLKKDYFDKTLGAQFLYWSTDKAGKEKITEAFVPDKNMVLYAQYDGLIDETPTGVAGFFVDLDNNILQPINAWWGIDSVIASYSITVLVLALGLALLIRLLITLFRSISFGR